MENYSDPYFVAGLIAVVAVTGLLTILSENRKHRKQVKWENAWLVADDQTREEMYEGILPGQGLEGLVTRLFMRAALRESHEFVRRQTEAERLGVKPQDVDRALLTEACFRRRIPVHPWETEKDLAVKLAAQDARDGAIIADRRLRRNPAH